MEFIRENLRELVADTRGVTAVEYGLLAASIAGGIVVAVTSVATNLSTRSNNIGTAAGSVTF